MVELRREGGKNESLTVLFTISINDIDVGLNTFTENSAGDTKIKNSQVCKQGKTSLRRDLREMSARTDSWELPLHANTYQILQARKKEEKIRPMNL